MVEVAMVEVSVVDIAMVEEIRQRELQWLGFSECGGPYRTYVARIVIPVRNENQETRENTEGWITPDNNINQPPWR